MWMDMVGWITLGLLEVQKAEGHLLDNIRIILFFLFKILLEILAYLSEDLSLVNGRRTAKGKILARSFDSRHFQARKALLSERSAKNLDAPTFDDSFIVLL